MLQFFDIHYWNVENHMFFYMEILHNRSQNNFILSSTIIFVIFAGHKPLPKSATISHNVPEYLFCIISFESSVYRVGSPFVVFESRLRNRSDFFLDKLTSVNLVTYPLFYTKVLNIFFSVWNPFSPVRLGIPKKLLIILLWHCFILLAIF